MQIVQMLRNVNLCFYSSNFDIVQKLQNQLREPSKKTCMSAKDFRLPHPPPQQTYISNPYYFVLPNRRFGNFYNSFLTPSFFLCHTFGSAPIDTSPNADDGLEIWPRIDDSTGQVAWWRLSINRVSCFVIDVSITLYIIQYR